MRTTGWPHSSSNVVRNVTAKMHLGKRSLGSLDTDYQRNEARKQGNGIGGHLTLI